MPLDWANIMREARYVVNRDKGTPRLGFTLRQLYWQLVIREVLPPGQYSYKALSQHVCNARRAGEFPALVRPSKVIQRPLFFRGPEDALRWLHENYQRDPSEALEWNIYVGCENADITEQMYRALTRQRYGVAMITIRSRPTQEFVDAIAADIQADGRPAVLIYLGSLRTLMPGYAEGFYAQLFQRTIRAAITFDDEREMRLPWDAGRSIVELQTLHPFSLWMQLTHALREFSPAIPAIDVMAREEAERQQFAPAGLAS